MDNPIETYEGAMALLLRERLIGERWDPAELWGMVASLVVAASAEKAPFDFVSRNLTRIRNAAPSLVVVPLANVTWHAPALQIAGGVVGTLDGELSAIVARVANGRTDLSDGAARDWIRFQLAGQQENPIEGLRPRLPVVAAYWTSFQRQRAIDVTARWIDDLCNISLLFERNTEDLKLWSLRGSHNRPGIRGIVLDRATVENLLQRDPVGRFELASEPFVASETFGSQQTVNWFSADPVPLDKLLADNPRISVVDDVAIGSNAIARRLRVAARWFAEAHWAINLDDAALSLGVALDAIVGSRSALPGRVMAQRFAYLEPRPSIRQTLVSRYNEIFSVRSAVAHGGESSRLHERGFLRSVASDVRWASERLVSLGERFEVDSEPELDAVFERLALGDLAWSED